MRQLLTTCFAAIACCIYMQSCITASVLKDAKHDRKPDRVRSIKSTGFDSAGTLLINFTARLDGRLKARPYHIAVNLDTAYAYYYQLRKGKTAGLQKTTYVNRVGLVYFKNGVTGNGLNMEFTRGIVENGFAPVGSLVNNATGVRVYKGYNLYRGYNGYDPASYVNAKNIVFIVPVDTAKQQSMANKDYVAISIEPSSKQKYTRYALVPLTATADVVTSPFQLIGYGFLYLLAKAMAF